MVGSDSHETLLEALVSLRAAELRLHQLRVAPAQSSSAELAHGALLAAQERFHSAFVVTPACLLEFGPDGRYHGSGAPHAALAEYPGGDGRPGGADGNVAHFFPVDVAGPVVSALREARERGVSVGREFALQLAGRTLWVGCAVFRDGRHSSGDAFYSVVLRNLTARKQVEEPRRRVWRFFELSTDAMCITDTRGCFLQVNPAFATLTGFTQEELTTKRFLDFVTPHDRRTTASELELLLAVRPSMHFENRCECKDGTIVTLSWTAYFDKDDGLVYATARDVTDRKRRDNEYHTIIQASLDGFWVTDFSGRILDVNESLCGMLGYSSGELLGMSSRDIECEEEDEDFLVRMRDLLRTGTALFQTRHRCKDGRFVDVEVSAVSLPRLGDRCFAFVRDISERRQADESLRQARKLLEDVEKLSRLGGWQYDTATGHTVWTDEVYRIYGVGKDYDPSDMTRNMAFYETEDVVRIAGAFSRAIDLGEPYDLELRLVRPGGERLWVRTTGTPLTEDGRVVSVTGNIVDITESKKMQEALRESEQRLRTIIETEPECVKLLDRDGRLVEMNATGLAMLEAGSLAHAQCRLLVDFVVPEYRAAFMALHARVMGGCAGILEFEIEGLNGTRRWLETHAAPMRDSAGAVTMLLGISRDITERKKAEQERRLIEAQLRESQKMEALGALAGGVAHDFNNILASIMGNVELARRDVGPDHPASESLDEIAKASRRAKDLVRQILAFGRRQVSSREVVALGPVVEEAGRLLRTMLPAGISLSVHCAADVPAVLADATQVEQVILNLCGNSWHAIRDHAQSGLIEVLLDAHEVLQDGVQAARRAGSCGDLRPGRYACLSVRDNGSGMDGATIARIFEPFFTTKPVGEGTGLGLAVVHGIVQEHDACVEVQSAVGQGSTFRVYFPAVDAPAPVAAVQAPQAAAATDGSGKRVLFVDDDDAIVFLMKRLLERQGYRVSAYTDPREALAAARATPDAFDLAVTDYNMAGMSGLDVARELRRIRADLPVAVASGYITEQLRAEAPQAGVTELIYKPNTVDDLCAAIARLAQSRKA